MFKKIIAWLLLITVTATVAVGGTLAYLTDRDSEANVFTTGDVSIDLKEDFEHGAELMPGVDIEKKPTITNTGENDAWVWLEFAVPTALDNWATDTQEGSGQNVIHWNQLGATTEGYVTETRVNKAIADGHLPEGTTVEGITAANSTWNLGGKTEFSRQEEIEVDGEKIMYNIYVIGYNKTLAPGEETLPNIYNVFMDTRVDIDPDGNWNFVENGVVTPLDWNSETNGNPIIYVSAYAMQAEGFADVDEAIRAYNAQWGDKGSEYADPLDPDVNGITNFKELKDAMYNGGKYALIEDIVITDKSDFYYGSYVTAVMKDAILDLNGHSITIDVEMESVAKAPVLFYVYKEGASLTVVGDGDVISKHDAFIFFPRSVSEGLYIYGGNYYNNDATSGTKNDINAIVYSQTNDNIHIYGGTFTFKNVMHHNGGFNVYDNSGAEIILHEGVLLSNSTYSCGSDADEIHLAEGCILKEVTIDGETWYQVVKQ